MTDPSDADRFREWNEDIAVTVPLTERERHHLLSLLKGSVGNPDCGICQGIAVKLAKVETPEVDPIGDPEAYTYHLGLGSEG